MATNMEVQLLEKLRAFFEDGFGNPNSLITDLGEVVQMSSLMMTNDNMWIYCVNLSEDEQLWKLLKALMIKVTGLRKLSIEQLRITKGIVLIVRNLLITHEKKAEMQSKSVDYNFFLEYFHLAYKIGKHLSIIFKSEEKDVFKLKTLDVSVVCFQCMFNILQCLSESSKKDLTEFSSTLDLLNDILVEMKSTGGVFEIKQIVLQFKEFCMSPEGRRVVADHDCLMLRNLITALTRSLKFAVDTDLANLKDTSKDDYNLVSTLAHTLIYLFNDEKIGSTMYRLERDGGEKCESMEVLLFLAACQMTFSIDASELESKWEWDFVAIGSMCLDFFHLYKERCISLLNLKTWNSNRERELSVVHRKMIAVLDIISNLLPYELFKKTLNSYDFLQEIIEFFKVVESNTERKRLKDSSELGLHKKSFPHAKIIIVEIVTYLVHGDFHNQEVVREHDGLQLVLTNCNLDVNEPFIRERCILCLKYLLENNQGNQAFIASLEAQRVEIDKEKEKVLEKCGYEVDIVNGKVQLKTHQGAETPGTEENKIAEL
ncbi:hypothetical protein PICMEDRAFT_16604 [Pichia membranifaciens NRRL Y-2026]|uniref:Ataxin-10 homolog n=1 Tax=Pichia membranifaciens NRRL Y-2026 TaxID=763406 RepID=A0A1E3NKX6_9ASCO|nr:hypothetical protein PICMEDRAFT_16604 [Pichia membranifaciens NRRL Y-2026]ODQ46779.1 hypothetical protein PICMEDRAFT_16604 [Pichia membranifaciens NRRL Y-2026]